MLSRVHPNGSGMGAVRKPRSQSDIGIRDDRNPQPVDVRASRTLEAPCRVPAAMATTNDPGQIPSLPSFSQPAISPDASEIAFVSGGSIWTVPTSGGDARLLIPNASTDSRPLYSPDGKQLALTSNRPGARGIHIFDFDSGDLKRVTFDDASGQVEGWSADGKWLYFSASNNPGGVSGIMKVSRDGGTPMRVTSDALYNENFAAPGPDGSTVAFTAMGTGGWQWWRSGHAHIDESEIWLMREKAAPPQYQRLSEGGAREMWPMWSPDGRNVYYVSDRSGADNVWMRPTDGGTPRQITQFTDGRVMWPNISRDGRTIAFERDFKIFSLDTASGRTGEVPITRKGATAVPTVEHRTITDDFGELSLSPDGKKIGLVTRGEVFAASAADGGDAVRITPPAQGPTRSSQITWSPDSQRLLYVSERDGTAHLFMHDFVSGQEVQLTNAQTGDSAPSFSPDGKRVAFVRDGRVLTVVDITSKQEIALATASIGKPLFTAPSPFAWSAGGKMIAYLATDDGGFVNAHVVPTDGSKASQPVSFLANTAGGTISWSPDSSFILFNTNQRTENGQVAKVDLVPQKGSSPEDKFDDLFKPDVKTQRAAAIDTDGIRRRLTLLPVAMDVSSQTLSPDGKTLLVVGTSGGQTNLFAASIDAASGNFPDGFKQLTATDGMKGSPQFTQDSKKVYYLDDGAVNVVSLDDAKPSPLAVTAELNVDFSRDKREVFRQAWTYMRDYFHDPTFGGLDWNGVRARYEPRIAGASTPEETRRLISMMVGELNASHLGIYGPSVTPVTGRAGLTFDKDEYERSGRLRVAGVVPNGPAALAGGIGPGDILTAVDGEPLTPHTSLDQQMAYKIGHRVTLTFAPSDGGDAREVAIKPVDSATELNLRYRQWVDQQRAYVAQASGGRLGYVHIPDMSQDSLNQLYVDLDSENQARDGVVVDVRNNNGGFVDPYAIDVISRRDFINFTPRDQATSPARRSLGQRALGKPTILLTNRNTLSDGEDFTEGYRALKLGKVVGEPTAGWIIFTSGVSLLDGSTFRLPFVTVTDEKGVPLERHPRPVDVAVDRPIGNASSDPQLDAAVGELLKQIDGSKAG